MNFDSGVSNVTNTTGITDNFTIGYDKDYGVLYIYLGQRVLWFVIAFFGLLLILFVFACSELLIIKTTGKSIHKNRPVDQHCQHGSDALPPPYQQYGPPTYNKTVEENGLWFSVPRSKKRTNLYVVPVHASAASDPTAAADVKMCATV